MIKIEVTGNSIPEVADKLLAIGASLRASTPAAFQPTEPVNSITPTKIDPVMPELREVAKAAPVDPTLAPKSAPVAEVSESQPTTTEPSSTPAPATSASEDEELEVVDLPIAAPDLEADVRPLILSVVEKRGKPVMEELLSRFGVVKASHIEPARLPELVALMQEALAK
jgi:hypothetical protein